MKKLDVLEKLKKDLENQISYLVKNSEENNDIEFSPSHGREEIIRIGSSDSDSVYDYRYDYDMTRFICVDDKEEE